MSVQAFYDELAPLYHLVYENWEASVARQGKAATILKSSYLAIQAADVAELMAAGFRDVPSSNPYWDRRGRTFEDVDGYRVVLQNAAWAD